MAQKQIQDLTLRDDFDDSVNLPGDDGVQTYRVTGAQIKAHVLDGMTSLANELVTGDKVMQSNKRYIVNKGASQCVMKLPATSAVGDQIEIVGLSTNSWVINSGAASQLIVDGQGTSSTSAGADEFLYIGSHANSSLRIVCTVANQKWSVIHNKESSLGLITSATGGTITTDGNYKVHKFTTLGSQSFTITTGTGPVEYLLVAGGGGGGNGGDGYGCGGGGGGGVLSGTLVRGPGTYTVIVGDGGAGGATDSAGSDGQASSLDGVAATGGGGGGSNSIDGRNGGSGGGESNAGGGIGLGTVGQGNNGGQHNPAGGGGGGGGAGAAATNNGNGGVGIVKTIYDGSNITYAGGGGGGYDPGGAAGAGGAGGGGGGGGTPGTANTGGGGGGSSGNGSAHTGGGKGGSGVVIVRYRFQ